MSILSRILSDLWSLLCPPICPVCGKLLGDGSGIICTHCRADVPLTGFYSEVDNPMVRRLWGQVPVVQASGFLFFSSGSRWRALIHAFKYRGAWRLAHEMGRWYGSYLCQGGLYADVDVVVPIPLHWRKRLRRGYNQSEYIARGIASALEVRVDLRSVRRSRNNPSQAQSRKSERWGNVQGVFSVRHPEELAGRHILLVDDVFTTGATMISCAEEILRAVPDCRISMASLAVSRRELGING